MNVSNTSSYVTDYVTNTQNKPQDLSQEQRDTVRQTLVGVAGHKSKEAQIDAYVQGSKSSSEDGSSSTYSENYTDFAADVRKSDNLTILVENGVELSSKPERPSTLPVQDPSELDQDQRDDIRQVAVGIAGHNSKEAQLEAYKAGTEQASSSNDELADTAQYVKNYNEFAADVRRSEYLNIYTENNNFLTG